MIKPSTRKDTKITVLRATPWDEPSTSHFSIHTRWVVHGSSIIQTTKKMIEKCFIGCFIFSKFKSNEKIEFTWIICLYIVKSICSRKEFSYVDFVCSRILENIYIYICILLERCNPCLSEIRWDVSCSEVSDKILFQVIPWMSNLIMRVLIKFSENLTYRKCRQINTYYGLANLKLWQTVWIIMSRELF